MVKISIALLKKAETGLSKALTDILVCPISKQPLRHCEKTGTLISDAIGVSFPIVDGIPCLVPQDGKILVDVAEPNANADASSPPHTSSIHKKAKE